MNANPSEKSDLKDDLLPSTLTDGITISKRGTIATVKVKASIQRIS
jgi:hypothetical protein